MGDEVGDGSDLTARLRAELGERTDLLPRGAGVLVAVSGGPDSMALLGLLAGLREELDLVVAAAHFDHRLRPESGVEAERVEAWCRGLGVRCRVGRAEEPLAPRQEVLRRARYRFLDDAADAEAADRIATGHTADDQVETILFRILRGTGIGGLRGIPRRRGRIVRPLLSFRREAILAYLKEREMPYLEDPSNLDPRWARGRIRSRVLPALEEAWGEPVGDRLLALGRAAGRAESALEEVAGRALEECRVREGWGGAGKGAALHRGRLRERPPEIQARVVRRAARERGVRLGRGGTRSAVEFINRGRSGGRVDLGDGLELAREFELLWVGRPAPEPPDASLAIAGPTPACGSARIGGREYRVEWGAGLPEGESRFRLRLPRPRLRFPLLVRGWEAGDRMRLPAGTRKLKRLFNDRRIRRSERSRLPVLATEEGRVLWVAGVARDAELAPREGEELFDVRIDGG